MHTKSVVVICTTVLVGLAIFWPTVYRYDHEGEMLVRTNRISGTTAILAGGSWVSMSEDEAPKSIELPPQEFAKVTGNAGLSRGMFGGKIYNGSDWTITKLYFVVTAKEVGGQVRWTRKMSAMVRIEPLETKDFSLPVTGDENFGSQEWDIQEAAGYASK